MCDQRPGISGRASAEEYRSTFSSVGPLPGLSQRNHDALRRGRLDRARLASYDDGEFLARSYWVAAVRREVTDHPESRAHMEDECSKCHMPMARDDAKQNGRMGQVFAHLPFDSDDAWGRLAADGVSCSLCHQIGKDKLGTPESFVGGFVIDPPDVQGLRPEYPYKIETWTGNDHEEFLRRFSSH